MCRDLKELWVFGLSLADTISDFVYFAELRDGNDVPEGVAYAVLGFAVCGLVSMMMGSSTQSGLTTGVMLEDFPQIVATTAIEAYVVGANVGEWSAQAIVSYAFSVFALQQKIMAIGFAPTSLRGGGGGGGGGVEGEEKPDFCWVLAYSIIIVLIALALAWGAAVFIIFLT